jgi:hypothetical protein
MINQTVFRSKLTTNFTVLPNKMLRDKRLSFKARGLLSLVLTNTGDWKITKGWIGEQTDEGEGREAVTGALEELKRFGYVTFEQVRTAGGFFDNIWSFYDTDGHFLKGQPTTGNRKRSAVSGQPSPVNRLRSTAAGNPSPLEEQGKEEPDKEELKEEESGERNGANAPDVASSKPETKMIAKAVVGYWNTKTELPSVKAVPSGRQRHLEARLKDSFWEENWKEAIDRIAASDFCLGKNDRKWRATFDFLLKPETVTKTMEGQYDNRNGKNPAKEGNTW